jgi:hypothetical protein
MYGRENAETKTMVSTRYYLTKSVVFFRCGCVASPEVPLQALASTPTLDQKYGKLATSVERQPMALRDGLEIISGDDVNNNAVVEDQPMRPTPGTEEKEETTDDSGCLELFDELLLLELTGGRRRQSTPFNNDDIWRNRPSTGNNSLDCDNCELDIDDDDGYIEELKNYGKIFFDELLKPYAAVQLRATTKTTTALTATTKNNLRNSWRCSDEASCQLAVKTDSGQSWPQPCSLRHCPAPDCDWNCEVGGLQDDLLLVWDCPECRLISEIVAAAGEKGCPSWTKDAAARQGQCSGDLGGQCRASDVLYDTGHGQSPLRTDRTECPDVRCHSRLEDAARLSRTGDSGRPRAEQCHSDLSPQRLLPSNPASGRILSLPPVLDRTRTSSTPAPGRSQSPTNLQSLARRIPNVTPAPQRAGTPSILSPPPSRLPPPSGGAPPALPPPSGGAPPALPPPPPPAPPKYSGRPSATPSQKPSAAEGSQQLLMSTAQLIGVDLVRH